MIVQGFYRVPPPAWPESGYAEWRPGPVIPKDETSPMVSVLISMVIGFLIGASTVMIVG